MKRAAWKAGAILVCCLACGARERPLEWRDASWCCASCGRPVNGYDDTPTAKAGGSWDASTSQAARGGLA